MRQKTGVHEDKEVEQAHPGDAGEKMDPSQDDKNVGPGIVREREVRLKGGEERGLRALVHAGDAGEAIHTVAEGDERCEESGGGTGVPPPQTPKVEPMGWMQVSPVQQSAFTVQVPSVGTHVVVLPSGGLKQRRVPVLSGMHGTLLQQSAADAHVSPA